jgi:hypothetical protein
LVYVLLYETGTYTGSGQGFLLLAWSGQSQGARSLSPLKLRLLFLCDHSVQGSGMRTQMDVTPETGSN